MEESRKKPILLGVIVVCLVVAGVITYTTWTPGGPSGIDAGIDASEMTWVKCRNPACEAEYQISLREYFKYIDAERAKDPSTLATPPLICEKCGQDSVYRAIKCESCGLVFETGLGSKEDFADRCPKCGHSRFERLKKEREAGG